MTSSARVRAGVETAMRSEWALALALLVVAEVELAFLDGLEHRPVAVVAAPFITLPVRWRRRAPFAAATVAVLAFAVQTAAGVSDNGQTVPTLVLVLTSFGLGRHGSRASAVAGTVTIAGIGAVAVALTPDDAPSDYVFVLLLVVGAVAAGVALRLRTHEAASQAHRAVLAEEASREGVRDAIETERRRIARELHDVVAHAISMMVLQAGAAEAVLADDPARARDPLRTIQDQGRAALVDMHHLLGVLRRPPDAPGLDPSPTLADLPALADQFRAAGLPVVLELDVDAARIPPSVEVSIHRVVREALTNVLRHAGRATAYVRLATGAGAVELEVRDDGRDDGRDGGRRAADGRAGVDGPGFGLVGMRERVALFGGEMSAGPHPDGGFVIRARLPLDAAAVSQ
jgi:signal transduction histidine kinase